MKEESAISCQFEVPFRFNVYFTEGVFDSSNDLLRTILREEGKRRERLRHTTIIRRFPNRPTRLCRCRFCWEIVASLLPSMLT